MGDLQKCLDHAQSVLDRAGIDGYDVEAQLLCEWVTGATKLDFVVRPDSPVNEEAWDALDSALKKRLAGMPVHRIMGFRGFYGLKLELSPATLEPRPDTETLVDQVLDMIEEANKLDAPLRILDLGTGTGAIALALLSKLRHAHAVGVDISPQALETAHKNAFTNGLSSRFSTRTSNWFEHVSGQFDVIVSNPPYIVSAIIPQLEREVRDHDPHLALDGGPDGLAPYQEIARDCAQFLCPNGIVCVEIGYDQAVAVKKLFIENGFDFVALRKDLGGNDRALAFL